MNDKVFGIDLGTTYSAIAFVNDFGQAEVIDNREGDKTTPSVVFFENASNYVVGKEAKNGAVLYHDTTVSLIKREMGNKSERIFFDNPYFPETISSLILKDLVAAAKEATGIDTDKVVITVPAYFGLGEREATSQAGRIAGLDVVGIVTEPVAAALSVGIKGDDTRSLLVYDLGGGTFDCTIMEMGPDKLEVIVIDGNRRLGGADWDVRLFDLVAQKFMTQAGLTEDPTDDENFAQRLLADVEACKKTLSKKERATIKCSYADAMEMVEITRQEFEEATASLVDETLDIAQRALETAQEKRPGLAIDDFLLVGGSSRMPMIHDALVGRFGWTLKATDYDLAVAKGAALYGEGVSGAGDGIIGESSATFAEQGVAEAHGPKKLNLNGRSVTLSNILSRGVGVLMIRDTKSGEAETYIEFLAHSQASLPLTMEETAATYGEGVTEIPIRIFEQAGEVECDRVEDNKEITPEEGAAFTGLPRLPKNSPIHITLNVDTEGLATVNAFEPLSGQNIKLNARLSSMQAQEEEEATAIVAGMIARQ